MTTDRLRKGLVIVMLAALLLSNFAAAQHAGDCCSRGAFGNASVLGEVARQDSNGSCGHHGCSHGNPFRRVEPSEASEPVDAVRFASSTDDPASEHDRESCSLCCWFTILSSGASLDLPLAVECGNVVFVAASGIESQSAAALFLPALSRRGPPEVA